MTNKKKRDDTDQADRAQRLDAVVREIASLSSTQRILAARDEATAKKHGISAETLQELVDAVVKENEKAEKDKARQEKEEATLAKMARRETERKAERERKDIERKAERKAEKEAARKAREREKGLAAIVNLPVAYREAELKKLAKRLGIDENDPAALDELREDLELILPVITIDVDIEPWGEPVSTEEALDAISAKVRKYASIKSEMLATSALWTAFTWQFSNAVHSPYLFAVSPSEGCGKSLLLGILYWMVPRPYDTSEPTAPAAYRLVDQINPTLFVDEAEDIFKRKPDLRNIINKAWTREKTTVRRNGRDFNFWCPKAFGLIEKDTLPRTIESRGFKIKMVPPMADEKLEDFLYADDDEFLTIRRKLLRWSIDNADAIKAIVPTYPDGFQQQNRPKANWKMPFQIAQHAGDKWLRLAHTASLLLNKDEAFAPDMGIEALAALKVLLKDKPWILSAASVTAMTADEISPWNAYRSPGRGPHAISQYELAALLKPYQQPDGAPIQPRPIKAASNKRGYRASQFKDAWERFADRIARVDVSWAGGIEPEQPPPPPAPKSAKRPMTIKRRKTNGRANSVRLPLRRSPSSG